MSKSVEVFAAVKCDNAVQLRDVLSDAPESVNAIDDDGLPVLFTAARWANHEAVDLLIQHGATIDIFACCYLDRPDVGQQLLDREPDLARARLAGRSPLHFAAQKGSHRMVALLIHHGADVNAADRNAITPLQEAAHGGPWKPAADQKTISLLLQHGAQTELHTAAEIGRVAILTDACRSADDINSRDSNGMTALYHAAHNNHVECVQLLLQKSADPHGMCEDGQTPLSTATLHLMSQQCDPQIPRLLIAAGAPFGIHIAAALNDVEQIRRLHQQNETVIDQEQDGFRPLDFAVHCGHTDALDCLLTLGADPNISDQTGQSLISRCAHLPELHAILLPFVSEI